MRFANCHPDRKYYANHCNRGLGAFYDNEELLFRAIDYLQKHRALSQVTNGN